MLGHFTALIARGPGPDLWLTSLCEWVADQAQRHVFTGTPIAVGTAILGLPAGYRASIIFVEKPVADQPAAGFDPCGC